jgi:hypothetical protein
VTSTVPIAVPHTPEVCKKYPIIMTRRTFLTRMLRSIFHNCFLSQLASFFLSFFFLYSFFIHMCIQCLGHFSPCPQPLPYPPLHPLPCPPTSSIPSRNYFALISNFVEERL